MLDDRECGACTVCCVVTPVDVPELQKQSNMRCPHCVEGGCGIYEQRPQVCRVSFCGWRYIGDLDASWRPDRSGVLILNEDDGRRPEPARAGYKLVLTGSDAPLGEPGFLRLVTSLVENRVPVSLSVPGPPGFHAVKAYLNGPLETAVRSADGAAITDILFRIAHQLRGGRFERIELLSDRLKRMAREEVAARSTR